MAGSEIPAVIQPPSPWPLPSMGIHDGGLPRRCLSSAPLVTADVIKMETLRACFKEKQIVPHPRALFLNAYK